MSSPNNNITLIGNLGRDPAVRETSSGQPVCNFDIAVDNDATGNANWIPVVVWGRQAEICGRHLQRGSLIALQGRLQTRSYQDSSGLNRNSFEVVAESVKFLANIKGKEADAKVAAVA